jgi:hypothetical protein
MTDCPAREPCEGMNRWLSYFGEYVEVCMAAWGF